MSRVTFVGYSGVLEDTKMFSRSWSSRLHDCADKTSERYNIYIKYPKRGGS